MNLALGKPYQLEPAPNYELCKDAGDDTQLTDGALVQGYFWAQKGTVGWRGFDYVAVTIDLGTVQPIASVAYHTAAGTAGVKLPRMIYVLVGDDGRNFYPVADIAAQLPAGGPGDATHPVWYRGDRLQAHGRYVRLLILPGAGSDNVFCDEVQVWRGADALLQSARPGPAFQTNEVFLTALGAGHRLRKDLQDVESRIAPARIAVVNRASLAAQASRVAAALDDTPLPVQPSEFKSIIPYDPIHRAIFRLNAGLLAAEGYQGLVAWTKHRYAAMGLCDPPARKLKALFVRMLNGERRAEVLNLTNATQADSIVQLRIEGLPDGANPDYVDVLQAEWWDTREGTPVLAPLVRARQEGAWYDLDVPSGMTRQIWLRFRPQALAARTFAGKLILRDNQGERSFPLNLQISPVVLPAQGALDLWMWDYTNDRGSLAITAENRSLAVADLQAHGVDTPCALEGVRPKVTAVDFDSAGNLIGAPGFTAFDEWVGEWPGASRYHVLLPATGAFLQFKAGTTGFTRALAQLAKAWAAHNRQLGLRPKQVVLQLVDEPANDAQYAAFATWAAALQSGTDDFGFFINPPGGASAWTDVARRALGLADIICPSLAGYLQDGAQARQFYEDFKSRGKSLRFYCLFWPGDHDPTACQRLVPWLCYARGFEGVGFWSYADAPRTDIWNDYVRRLHSYSPVFIEPAAIATSKHWEALQEGMEDCACLRLLQRQVTAALARQPDNARALAAGKFLEGIETRVIRRYLRDSAVIAGEGTRWTGEREVSLPDDIRLQALDYLEKLQAPRR